MRTRVLIAELASGDRILPAALVCHPHVALLDIDLPGADGLTADDLVDAVRRVARGERVFDARPR